MNVEAGSTIRIKQWRLRILVVDDTDSFRESLVVRLEEVYGAIVESLGSGVSAIKAIENGTRFDLILMDFAMPIMNGIEAAKAILAKDDFHRIVLMSAHPENEGKAKLIGLGFLSKPIETPELEKILVLCGEG